MEEQAIPQADFIRKVHDLHMRHFHDFAHGGSGHVMRRHGENAVEPNYPLNELELLVSLGIEARIRVGVEIFSLINDRVGIMQLYEKAQVFPRQPLS